MTNGLASQITQSADHFWMAVLRWGYPDFPMWVLGLVALTILIGWPGERPHDDKTSHHTLWWRIRIGALGAAILGVAFAILYRMLAYRVLPPDIAAALVGDLVERWWVLAITVPCLAVVLRILFVRYGRPWLSAKLRDSRVGQRTEALSDIREEVGRWGTASFDPRALYAPGQVFTAVNDNRTPARIPTRTFLETHKCVIGATRFGKGVTFQGWADQAILRGDSVWMFDPKGDEFLPVIMRARAKELGRPFVLVDLKDLGHGTWSPLEHGSLEERAVRMTELLGLKERGTDADHYKALSTRVLREVLAQSPRTNLGNLLKGVAGTKLDEDQTKALLSPMAKLERFAARRGLSPKAGRGLNVEESLTNNAVVYIIGSIDDADITLATRLLLTELVQAATRMKANRTSPLTIFVDELKFLASETITRVLAAAASANINMTVAFQSFADMLSPDDKTLDGRAVLQSVLTNCQVKMIFGGTDAETAEWVAAASGTVRKRVAKMERTKVGALGGETWEDQRMLGDAEEALIPENTVLSLPPGRAVLFQPGQLAAVVQVSPIRTPETEAIAAARTTAMAVQP